ncbi:MAG: AraC-like DNA-binding protein [Alteromonadaceae bacterium]|jgi:AraC-like DNA-binding protein
MKVESLMNKEHFFKEEALPFIECRYSQNSGRHYKAHMHSTFSIGAIDNGEVLYNVSGQEALLKKNALAIINPDTLHYCNPLQETPRSYYMLYLDTDWCMQIQASLFPTTTFIPADLVLLKNKGLYEAYINMMQSYMQDLFLLEKEQMVVSFLHKLFGMMIKNNSQITKLLTKRAVKQLTKQTGKSVNTLKTLLSSRLNEDITLNSFAQNYLINPYTLLRRFKAEVGVTPHVYRMNYRIEKAKILLQQQASIADVVFECGFFDQSHFHRYFKSFTTVTPKEYQLNFIQ